jgi:hypothetical protein
MLCLLVRLNVGEVSAEGTNMMVSFVDEGIFIKPVSSTAKSFLLESGLDVGI